jgi:hypothetical protein
MVANIYHRTLSVISKVCDSIFCKLEKHINRSILGVFRGTSTFLTLCPERGEQKG